MKKLLALLTLLLMPALAHSELVTFGFTGNAPGVGPLESQTPFFGTYTFESVAADPFGRYSFSGAPFGLTLHYGNLPVFHTDTLYITVENNVPMSPYPGLIPFVDHYTVFTRFAPPDFRFFIDLQNCSAQAFDSTALLLDIDLSLFRPNCVSGGFDEVIIVGQGVSQSNFTGARLITLARVGEAPSWWLLGLGLVGLIVPLRLSLF